MPGENSTNQPWLQKLTQLGQLPGESFDKNEAWQKLDMRLQGKKSEKKTGWLWMAAAIILIPLSVIILLKEQKQQIGSAFLASPINRVTPFIAVVNTPANPARIKKIIAQQPEKSHSLPPEYQELISEKTVSETGLTQQKEVTQPIIQSAPDTLVQRKQTALVNTKRKMKVVHYNELNELPPQSPPQDKNTGVAHGVPGFKRAAIPAAYEPEQAVITHKKPGLPFGSLISSKN